MFDYNYLTPQHLKGLDKYKYSAIDTSPLSQYVMHPTWNFIVKFIPNWVAPNLITFAGFLCMVVDVALLSLLDYDITSSGGPGGGGADTTPNWVFTLCGLLLFLAYNLDGIDGKQARKIGVSGPLGEMFDHGLDSYIVFLIPFCLFSVFGRGEYSLPCFRAFLIVASVVLNFYVSHWEKYNTGTLYLPWGYDVSMWISSLLFIVAGIYGPGVYKTHTVFNLTFAQALEIAIHSTGLLTTLPISTYNVYLSYKNDKGKMSSLSEALRPLFPIAVLLAAVTAWALCSPTNIVEHDPRALNMLFGTLFSNIASRLIVAEMSGQRCEAMCWTLWPLLAGVAISLYQPLLELPILYTLTIMCILTHVHYGACVARQMCKHYKINCFTVPKAKRK